jgi:hypothetical protein
MIVSFHLALVKEKAFLILCKLKEEGILYLYLSKQGYITGELGI